MDKRKLSKAFFLRNARRIEDIEDYRKKCIEKQIEPKLYCIEKTIKLSKIDYENFSTDLLADRDFIEDNAVLMFVDKQNVWHCLLIVEKGNMNKGILVECKKKNYAMYSAVYYEKADLKLL